MPVSKDGILYYTKEQNQRARERNNALDYARSQGYDLIPKGKDFTLRDHTSMVFTEDGWWHWNGRNFHGRAVEFIMFYEDGLMEKHPEYIKKAIIKLAGENIHTQQPTRTYAPRPEHKEPPPKDFQLPPRHENSKRVYAYLTQARGISPELVRYLFKENKLYESSDYHNAVFVFQDNQGTARGAALRGVNSQVSNPFKGMANGSNRSVSHFSFGGGSKSSVACVFEAPIDAMSYAVLQQRSGNSDLGARYYVATGGAGDSNFLAFLEGHPHVKSVILCQDNDDAGHRMADGLGTKLRAMGYQVSRSTPKEKDFNADLINERTPGNSQKKETAATVEEEKAVNGSDTSEQDTPDKNPYRNNGAHQPIPTQFKRIDRGVYSNRISVAQANAERYGNTQQPGIPELQIERDKALEHGIMQGELPDEADLFEMDM